MQQSIFSLLMYLVVLAPAVVRAADSPPDYAKHVAPLFRKYCVGCHGAIEPEGKLNLASYAALMRGGENGKVLVPKNVAKSRLIGMLERKTEPFMPPEGNKGPTKQEIALLKAWIKGGAEAPQGISPDATLIVPKIKPKGKVRRAVHAVAVGEVPRDAARGLSIAVARHGVVELIDAKSGKRRRALTGLTGDVTDVAFSRDGKLLAAACGEPGLFGRTVVWDTKTWKVVADFKGHRDGLYVVAISPNGKLLATGSYDQKIKLWDLQKKREVRQLDGHNGPVHDLAFHPSGKVLASASGDRTVKLWDVATGKRLVTLGQPEKAQYALAFSPDGRRLIAGGVDNRIRVWNTTRFSKRQESQSLRVPLLSSRFAHEAAILRLVYSPDGKRVVSSGEDRAVKLWDTKEFTQLHTFKNQPDWVTGLAVSRDGRTMFLGRLDGSFASERIEKFAAAGADVEPVRLPPVPRPVKGSSGKTPTVVENEPNDRPDSAQRVKLPATIKAVLNPGNKAAQDFDLYRFRCKKGETWILETHAARNKSPADTRIDVLHPDGEPVLRHLLRAVRDSYITFRPIDSRQTQVRVKNWEEMDLNQYLYMGGEVCRLFRMPQGPDSGFLFYSNRGKRRTYFDTSATVHAKDDPVYIVEAYPPGTKLAENGLPVFPLYYSNDDDGEREAGADSRLTFTAPADGEYLVRVRDVRGLGGKDFKYALTIRKPRPDFRVTFAGAKATVPAGSGQRLTVNVDRIDGFNGEIRIDVTGMPRGFSVTSPIIVQADHLTAKGVIHVAGWVTPTVPPKSKKGSRRGKRRSTLPVAARKPVDWSRVKVTATAKLHGKTIRKPLPSIGPIQVGPKPKVLVRLVPDVRAKPQAGGGDSNAISLAPGTTTTAMLLVERNGYNGDLRFDVDHLPHGVIVDNIGLSGILVRAGETKRRIYLTASDWVPETTRLIDAVAKGQGNQASPPIRLYVRQR